MYFSYSPKKVFIAEMSSEHTGPTAGRKGSQLCCGALGNKEAGLSELPLIVLPSSFAPVSGLTFHPSLKTSAAVGAEREGGGGGGGGRG